MVGTLTGARMSVGSPGTREDMAPDAPDWTVSGPVRALMWWPGVAFVLVMIAPEAAAGSIAVAGLVLAAVGLFLDPLSRRLDRAEPDAVEPDREPVRSG